VDGTTPGQYFDPQPQVTSRPRPVRLTLPDLTIDLTTDTGVFSGDGVDAGTKYLLLDGPPPPPGPVDLLDLGCGYGPIAITLAKRAPQATVWAVDVNERAVSLCAANARAAGASGVRAIVAGDAATALTGGLPADVRFAAIYSNPPIRIGKPALHALLDTWLRRLATGGHAYLVVQKHLGSDSLVSWLEREGWPTTRISSRSGFRLLDVSTPRPDPATERAADPPSNPTSRPDDGPDHQHEV
jgi:16S rRNA (guanine1207-N2)-methyltransferase